MASTIVQTRKTTTGTSQASLRMMRIIRMMMMMMMMMVALVKMLSIQPDTIERDYHLVSHQLLQGSAPVCSYTHKLANSNTRQILNTKYRIVRHKYGSGCFQCFELLNHAKVYTSALKMQWSQDADMSHCNNTHRMRKNLCTCKRNNVCLMRSSRTEVMLYQAMALVGDKTKVKAQNLKKTGKYCRIEILGHGSGRRQN